MQTFIEFCLCALIALICMIAVFYQTGNLGLAIGIVALIAITCGIANARDRR